MKRGIDKQHFTAKYHEKLIFENRIIRRTQRLAKQKKTEIEVSEKQIEIFARRLLPEIKKFYADENIRKEFKEWQQKRQDGKTSNINKERLKKVSRSALFIHN